MGYYFAVVPRGQSELYHFGIKGMKWGVRRFRNADGSYTAAGRRRYGLSKKSTRRPTREQLLRSTDPDQIYKYRRHYSDQELQQRLNRLNTEANLYKQTTKAKRRARMDKFAKGALKTVAIAGPSMYGAYSLWKKHKNPNWKQTSWLFDTNNGSKASAAQYMFNVAGTAANAFGGKTKK